MTDEQTSALQEVAPPVQELESPNHQESDQQINWRRANEALREARRREKELEARIQQLSVPQRQEEPELHISEDDVITGATLRKILQKTIQRTKEEVVGEFKKMERQKAVKEVVSRADYQDVLDEYLPTLIKHYPHLASAAEENPTIAPAMAYEAIVNSKFYHEAEERKRTPMKKAVVPKVPEPASGMTSGGSPLNQANDIQHMAIGEDTWREWVKRTGYSGR